MPTPNYYKLLIFLLLIVPPHVYGQVQSLAGKWNIRLDTLDQGLPDKWFTQPFTEAAIELPGSCEQRGFGVKNTIKDNDRLTRAIKYEGKAWYQRQIEVPASWQSKRVELFLERCHWVSAVWIDDKPFGTQNSLSAPHLYDLGTISAGQHTLTILVDNAYGKLPIGPWGFAITDDTQTNWNGIIGRMELKATDKVWIKDAQVFDNHLQIKIGNNTGKIQNAFVRSKQFTIPVAGTTIDLPFKTSAPYWDEFSPLLQQIVVTLQAGKYSDKKTVEYGLKTWATNKGQFVLNGRPILVRGPVNECVYPITGYPPMDKASWLHVLGICKSYGFNFMRFNSWCPPEAAFQAADDMGMFLQIELPCWTLFAPEYGVHPDRDQFLAEELQRILETYGNHPSFAFMAMGNESDGPLEMLANKGRLLDNRRLYRCQNIDTITNGDYAERGTDIGQRGIVGPRTNWDRWSIVKGEKIEKYQHGDMPVMAHEVGQWSSYPDFDQLAKFTGNLKPYNYERFRNLLAAHQMADQNKAFARASGKFAVSLYKDEIEGCMRTWPYGGFQIVEARDFTGEGTAIIGWLDAFWDSKGLITPQQFRQFCAPQVCLLRLPKRIYTNNEELVATASVANYGPADIHSIAGWKIQDEAGAVIASGTFASPLIKTGKLTGLGSIKASFKNVSAAKRLTVTVSAAGTTNSWNVWVYPASQPAVPQGVKVVYAFDDACRKALADGESVLLFSSPKQGLNTIKNEFLGADSIRQFPPVAKGKSAIPGSYLPAFWDMRLFNQVGTLGILCNPQHPALAGFPTEEYSDWQWADIMGNFTAQFTYNISFDEGDRGWGDKFERSKSIILNETPEGFRPIVQVIDNYERNYKLGAVFETRAGNGRLLVCALDLDTGYENRPAAQQLKNSLLQYAASENFKPEFELPAAFLERILTF